VASSTQLQPAEHGRENLGQALRMVQQGIVPTPEYVAGITGGLPVYGDAERPNPLEPGLDQSLPPDFCRQQRRSLRTQRPPGPEAMRAARITAQRPQGWGLTRLPSFEGP